MLRHTLLASLVIVAVAAAAGVMVRVDIYSSCTSLNNPLSLWRAADSCYLINTDQSQQLTILANGTLQVCFYSDNFCSVEQFCRIYTQGVCGESVVYTWPAITGTYIQQTMTLGSNGTCSGPIISGPTSFPLNSCLSFGSGSNIYTISGATLTNCAYNGDNRCSGTPICIEYVSGLCFVNTIYTFSPIYGPSSTTASSNGNGNGGGNSAGSACVSDADCDGGGSAECTLNLWCQNRQCVASKSVGQACSTDPSSCECGQNAFCANHATCTAPLPNGQACSSNFGCQSDFCDVNVCASTAAEAASGGTLLGLPMTTFTAIVIPVGIVIVLGLICIYCSFCRAKPVPPPASTPMRLDGTTTIPINDTNWR